MAESDFVSARLKDARFFTPFESREAGIAVYILDKKAAPFQQGFYFVNDGMSADGRYLWFYCAFPPSLAKMLGVLDFKTGELNCFPETQFDSLPFIDPVSGTAYWGMAQFLWRRGPGKDDPVELVNSLPEEILEGRTVTQLASHLTRTADGKSFAVDARVGLQYVFGMLPVDGGDFVHWHTFNRFYDHAAASPVDPDTVLFAQEIHEDPLTGLHYPITNRLWLLQNGRKPRPILREPRWVSHEWWDPDGSHVWCVWDNETWRVDVATGEEERIIFPHHCWHSHSSMCGSYIAGDSNNGFYRGCASSVSFLNRKTNKLVRVMDHPVRPDYTGRYYHIDPHPRFCCKDQYIVFTTCIRNEIDVAIVRVEDLVALTS